MVDRFSAPYLRSSGFTQNPIPDNTGKWVRYSDYAKLEAQLAELEAENKWQATSIEILRRHAFHWKDRAVAAEYLASTGAVTEAMVEAAADEIVDVAEIDFNGTILNRAEVARNALKAAMEAGR